MQRVFRNPGTIIISALLLLLIATGVAQAAIGSNGIKNNSLKSADIKDNALTSADIKNDSLTSNDVKANSLKAADLAPNSVGSSEITDSSVASGDIKNGTVASGDLANGSVTASKIAPGAVPFPNALWGTMLRNQTGAAESGFQVGPTGQPLGDGSLRLFVAGASDGAAFGNSFDFARFQLEDITNISYATYNADDPPLVRPSLRIEIDPHLLADDTAGGLTEFTTLIHEPDVETTGWATHDNTLADANWYLTGDEGTTIDCTQANPCTFTEVRSALDANVDDDAAAPEISTGVYFGLGAGSRHRLRPQLTRSCSTASSSTSSRWECS